MHNLSLDILDRGDCNKLVVYDTSLIDPLIPVTNTILEIKTPLVDDFKVFELTAGWKTYVLDCTQLCVCCGACNTLLPDGLYEIKFSVNPNLTTMVEYNYFRVCQLWKQYLQKSCELRNNKARYSKAEYVLKLEELYNIRNMIIDAKAMAEDCLNVEAAYELYNEAKTLLNDKNDCPSCK